MCTHEPPCPEARNSDRLAARLVAAHPELGWSLLCNGVVVFDDTGELLPDGSVVTPHRPAVSRNAAERRQATPQMRVLIARFATTPGGVGLYPAGPAVAHRVKVVSAREADKH